MAWIRWIAAVAVALLAPATSAQDARTQQVDLLFDAYTRPGSPGCAIGIVSDGQIAYRQGYGLASLELGVPIDPAVTVFDTGSLAKPFTAMSVLLLERDRKLSLDDSIRAHVPGLPSAFEPVTLRQLLHHTGGAGDYTPALLLGGVRFEDVAGAEDVMRLLTRTTDLTAPAGTRYEYSNTGFFLLGQAVQSASGRTLPDFAHERIFQPLGMTRTRFLDNHTTVVPGRAASYAPDGKGGYSLVTSNWEMVGDGALLTTAEDMVRWAAGLGSEKVGGPALVQALQTKGALNDGTPIKAARSVVVDTYRGRPIAVSTGSWAGFIANQLRFPEDGFAVMTLCNVADADVEGIGRKVADIYLADRFSPVPAPTPVVAATGPAATRHLVGTYANLDEGIVGRVSEKDGKIWYADGFWTSGALAPAPEGGYRVGDGPSRVAFAMHRGAPHRATLRQDGYVVQLEPVLAPTLASAALREYEGTYRSAVLDATAEFVVLDGKLTYRARRVPPFAFTPIAKDAFVGPYDIIVRFSRDASNRIIGFTYAQQRFGRFPFVRTAMRE